MQIFFCNVYFFYQLSILIKLSIIPSTVVRAQYFSSFDFCAVGADRSYSVYRRIDSVRDLQTSKRCPFSLDGNGWSFPPTPSLILPPPTAARDVFAISLTFQLIKTLLSQPTPCGKRNVFMRVMRELD